MLWSEQSSLGHVVLMTTDRQSGLWIIPTPGISSLGSDYQRNRMTDSAGKRQRERRKREKKREKALRKEERKAGPTELEGDVAHEPAPDEAQAAPSEPKPAADPSDASSS